jgi:HlyD family secretion protein
MRRIFRQHAWEHFSSPEQLDQLLQVVSPHHWLALATCGALVGVALLWGIFGRLPTTVMGQGVLIHPRQVVDVQAPASGRLATLAVQEGDVIHMGDVLGTIEQTDMRRELQEARAREHELLTQDRAKSTLQAQQATLQAQHIALEAETITLQRHNVRKRLGDAQARGPILRRRLENRQRLEAMELVACLSDERLRAEQAYLDNQDTIAALQAELKQLDSKVKQLKSLTTRQTLEDLEVSTMRKNQLQELQSRIAVLEVQLAREGQIISPANGRLLELTMHVGQVLQPGQRLGSLAVEDPASRLVGVSYFPIKAGKKIQPGMRIHVAPDTAPRERFGSLLGTVTAVSPFPVTKEGIARVMGNAEVVAALAEQGPVIEVVAALTSNPATASGYAWSSSAGSGVQITPGTTTTGRVVLERRAPMTYLLPILREASGLY